MKPTKESCCGTGDCGCQSEPVKKKLNIEFLYLDLTQCERCQGTDANLDGALAEVSGVLAAAGYEVQVDKINISTRELAVKHQFLSSPTIRINGRDIELDVRESNCTDCGDLCGDTVDCRVFCHEGVEYSEPPKAMIIQAILKEVFGLPREISTVTPYELPDNLAKFFDSLESREKA